MRRRCSASVGGKNLTLFTSTKPSSGASIPAMQARTVLFPVPDAPKSPNDCRGGNSSETSTLKSRRCLTTWALSMAPPLRQHVNQPGKRQSYGEKRDQQWHHRGQAEALQVDPQLHRHSRGIVGRDHHGAEFADGPHPGQAESDGQSEPRKRKRHAEEDLDRWQSQQRRLLLQRDRNSIQSSYGAQNVVAHADINLRGGESCGAVGHGHAVAGKQGSHSSVGAKGQGHKDAQGQRRKKNGNQQDGLPEKALTRAAARDVGGDRGADSHDDNYRQSGEQQGNTNRS